jgi:hypothetical protein
MIKHLVVCGSCKNEADVSNRGGYRVPDGWLVMAYSFMHEALAMAGAASESKDFHVCPDCVPKVLDGLNSLLPAA